MATGPSPGQPPGVLANSARQEIGGSPTGPAGSPGTSAYDAPSTDPPEGMVLVAVAAQLIRSIDV